MMDIPVSDQLKNIVHILCQNCKIKVGKMVIYVKLKSIHNRNDR